MIVKQRSIEFITISLPVKSHVIVWTSIGALFLGNTFVFVVNRPIGRARTSCPTLKTNVDDIKIHVNDSSKVCINSVRPYCSFPWTFWAYTRAWTLNYDASKTARSLYNNGTEKLLWCTATMPSPVMLPPVMSESYMICKLNFLFPWYPIPT